jgi:N-acetylmuramoyl-L-alanine amidase
MPIRHVVRQGECLNSIADQYGFFPRTIWDHPDNAELAKTRQPGVLRAGDVVVVPDKRLGEVECATGKVHRFRRRGVPALLRVQVRDEDIPRANEPFVIDIDGQVTEGTTDGDGLVAVPLPPRARRAVLTVGKGADAQEYDLSFGHLDPPDTVAGVQGRLKNLGFDCDVTGNLDERTTVALQLFQEHIEHPHVTGELDDSTRQKLLELHAM